MSARSNVIPFVKANACGNDFLIIDGGLAPSDLAEFSRKICDRHRGVGADGVEWLYPASDADVQARLFNADGSEAEISGNGTRCVAAHLYAERGIEKLAIRTGAGIKTCSLTARNDSQYEFEITMGVPRVDDELRISLPSGEVRGIPVSMGNPHYVVFVDVFAPDWQCQAAEIGQHHSFKHGVNVELVNITNKTTIDVRFFERGVGETQSSGTGSCASAVATIATGQAVSPVRVHAPGGAQLVRWEGDVFLRGPAQLVCRGEFFI
jgi:diaminopimelate epimerase